MATQTSPYELFGLDLRGLVQQFNASWRAVAQTRQLAWLAPAVPVRLLRADGTVALWRGGVQLGSAKDAEAAEFEAVEIPEGLVLRKRLPMPDLPDSAIAQAVELEARAATPFAVDDLIWGAHNLADDVPGKKLVEMVIASRRQITQYLDERRHGLGLASDREPEVWIFAGDGHPIVVNGWGEQHRSQQAIRQRRVACVLIAVAVLIVGFMAITPSLQLRARSLDAISAFEGMQRETTQAGVQREAFTHSVERLEVLRGILSERIDMLRLMTALTKALPDDTYLQSMQTQGLKVSIQGLTGNAATLMQTLGSVPGFREVRAPTAATRALAPNAENFRIEIQLDPAVFSTTADAATASAPAAPLPADTAAAVNPPSSPASSASGAPLPMVPASAEAPRKSRFTR